MTIEGKSFGLEENYYVRTGRWPTAMVDAISVGGYFRFQTDIVSLSREPPQSLSAITSCR